MQRHLPIYLRVFRKRWGLTQAELGSLLSRSASGIGKVETLANRPTIDIVAGSALIFGESSQDLFPALHAEIEDAVGRQAKLLYEQLEGRSDLASQEKLRLLTEMVRRMEPRSFEL